jgi:hypothetical protein
MKTIVLLFSILICSFLIAQTNPVKFHSYAQNDTLVFEATIDKGWHLYAAHLPNPYEGPLPTELVFNASPDFQLNGAVIEPAGTIVMDDAFGVEVKYFKNTTIFKQPFQRITAKTFQISGVINYMVCNDQMCIPLEHPFVIDLK